VLQREDDIRRVAREFAEDLAADGIVHGEVRYAPELSTAGGLSYDEVLAAILAGFEDGPADVEVRLIVCALRHLDNAARRSPPPRASPTPGSSPSTSPGRRTASRPPTTPRRSRPPARRGSA
jgi:adenosine deaminase